MTLRRLWLYAAIIIIAAIATPLFRQEANFGKLETKPDGAGAASPGRESAVVQETDASYDVIVAGTDPEGIAAAVSAARNGLRVLLADGYGREKLGGLITLGWLNSLDMNYAPGANGTSGRRRYLNQGLFKEWYERLEGTSIDVGTAEQELERLVRAEERITVLLGASEMKPLMNGTAVAGMTIADSQGVRRNIRAGAVIDATQNGDIAALAGAPYTVGREDLGHREARMAVTLVFKLKGITDQTWRSIGSRRDTRVDRMSGWGFPEARLYKPSRPDRVALRGLNLGRQNDGTVLVNAMQLFGVDPLDPQSVRDAMAVGREEAPRIADYLKRNFKELSAAEFAGTAPELYVRESRHIVGEYRLTAADLMENRDFPDAVAYGSYDVDIQRTGPDDYGWIVMSPYQYGVPFRCLVPLRADNLLVVGRAASFDSIPHGSARVIPLGMATGQAAGAAVKLAAEHRLNVRELSRSPALMAELRDRLVRQGMDLTMNRFPEPAYKKHPAYRGLLAAVGIGMASGGYRNDRWELDGPSTVLKWRSIMLRLTEMYPDRFPGSADTDWTAAAGVADELPLRAAAAMLCAAAGLEAEPGEALERLRLRGWVSEHTLRGVADPNRLTNGESYLLLRDMLDRYAGIVFE